MNLRDILKRFRFGGTAAATSIPLVQSVETLKMEPGDSLVLRVNQYLHPADVERIKTTFKTGFHGRFKNTPIIILDGGASMQVLKVTPAVDREGGSNL